jgi:hypothetical protein
MSEWTAVTTATQQLRLTRLGPNSRKLQALMSRG